MSDYLFHFLAFYLAGLAVNLTPCVYPMVTVTVSLFEPRDSEALSTMHAFGRAFIYVFGMVVMYSVLGVVAALTGALFGGMLQNKWVVVSVAFLMFILAFSMFGFYHFQVPSRLLEKLGALRKANYLGLFFSGMFVGIFAAPCIGPPVVALLASVVDKGNLFFGFSSFFVFALGLGTPYLILGTFSGLLQKLPKGGPWLIWVKHLFGVILFGFGLFYLAIAIDSDLIKWVLPGTVVGGGIYLGFFRQSPKENVLFVRFRWIVGIVSLVVGISLASPIIYPKSKERLVWEPYKLYKIAMAKEQHKPVMIDFYADWCISCHELEDTVFSNPTVLRESSEFVKLRVDATKTESPEVQKVLEQYNVPGLPIIVFIDASGNEVEDARIIGPVPPEEFLKSLTLTSSNAPRS